MYVAVKAFIFFIFRGLEINIRHELAADSTAGVLS